MTAATSHQPPRKGASRAADIPAEVLQALSRGELESATLTEGLALDQALLLRATFPELSPAALKAAESACQLGILKRMSAIGALMLDERGTAAIEQCRSHGADTVRGWACFMIGAQTELTLAARLAAIRPLAADPHFAVREWAWLAVRPQLVQELEAAINQLAVWTTAPCESLRRFASEALRPRGVWCRHIDALKRHPERGLPLLSPLRADPSRYVQDSVANWLNDAAKDHPDWVNELCIQWLQHDPCPATRRICQRARRNLK
ncbi:hypothetical protein [Kushneria aurantia]|uniref:DNA alkylation repair protein n=1 Tax=Kushneria aurantia TaxID=504092 RepID=A0ABV6G3C7_9GAMM|nr:hypothetical protein [Kushneria aurantia]